MRRASIGWSAVSLKWCLGTLLALVVVNLPYRYGEFACETLGEGSEFRPSSSPAYSYQTDAIYGGWPWRYVTLDSPPESDQPIRWASATWSLDALLRNLAVALAVVATMTLLVCRSLRLATVSAWAVALAAISWGMYHAHQDRAVAERLVTHATVYRSAIAPVWVTRFVPSFGLRPFVRIRGVMLCQYDQAMMETIARLPSLHTLGIWDQIPPAAQLQPLSLRPRLCKLMIVDADLEAWVPQFIARQTSLRHLELCGCRGLADGLAELERLTCLEIFDGADSDLPLSSLSDARWAQRLRHMRLTHPSAGEQTLELSAYLSLESLTISTRSGGVNPDLLTIRLDGMPQLQRLLLASSQKVDLSIGHAPRLQELRIAASDDLASDSSFSDSSNTLPLGLWLQRLSLDHAPSLRKLHCYGVDLEDILIQRSPNLIELRVDAYRGGEQQDADDLAYQLSNLSGLIKGLSKSSGPMVIDLSTLPLRDVDLAPLAQNKRIRELKLASTGVSAEQLHALLTLPRLKTLDVRNCPISNVEAAELLLSKPQLKQFLVDSASFEQIEVVNQDQLVDYTIGASPQASSVRIAGSPLLRSELVLGSDLDSLCIEDGCSLQGLSINGPVPRDTTLQGLRDLRFLALGGTNVDDRIFAPVWQCLQLNDLTLAYAQLTRQAWHRMSRFKNLRTLIIPGADIDDSVTDQWRELEHLRVVDFSHTRVSRRTLWRLLSQPNLQRLALNYVDLEKSDLQGLEDVLQLIELEVAGIGLEEEALRALLERGLLDRLDLSDCVLTPECLRILASDAASHLVFLGLRNCGLGDAEVRSILDAQPKLAVDVEGNPLSETFREQLQDSDRLLSRCDRAGFLRRIASSVLSRAPENITSAASTTVLLGETCDKIDIHQFALPRLVTAAR